jgi:hypothetical protein
MNNRFKTNFLIEFVLLQSDSYGPVNWKQYDGVPVTKTENERKQQKIDTKSHINHSDFLHIHFIIIQWIDKFTFHFYLFSDLDILIA